MTRLSLVTLDLASLDKLPILLALNGAAVLVVSLFGGLLLYRASLSNRHEHGWHLLHAGAAGRGIMLLALAPAARWTALPDWLLWTAAALIVVFVWTSTLAMIVVAVTGERGFGWFGPPANKCAFGLYAIGAAAVFSGLLLLIVGWVLAL
jgi:hypothetical protein